MVAKKKKKKPTPPGSLLLSAFVLCENYMEDKSGIVTLFRIVDRIEVQGNVPPELSSIIKPSIGITAAVILKSDVPQKFVAELRVESPSGKVIAQAKIEPELKGNWHTVNLRYQMFLSLESPGFYWFRLYINARRFARAPLFVQFETEPHGRDQDRQSKAPGLLTGKPPMKK
jgi:hypothetical protein